MNKYETLSVEKHNHIIFLSINRPKQLNALNETVLNELLACITEIKEDKTNIYKALIISGVGEKAFVAGADIKNMKDMNEKDAYKFSELGQHCFTEISHLNIPVVAAIQGYALGGGAELALSADFRIAHTNTKIGFPEITLGLIPGFGGTQRLSLLCGISKAKYLILSGKTIHSSEALALNIVDIVTSDSVKNAALNYIAPLLKQSSVAIGYALEAMRSVEKSLDMNKERKLFSKLFNSYDTKEGITAFLEKRKPQFRDQ